MFRKKLKIAPNKQKMRPAYGKCPGCKVGEREWCKNDCTLLDMANLGRE